MSKVTIYSSPTCVNCMMTKNFLQARKIPFDVVDMTIPENLKKYPDIQAIPVITYKEQKLIGFNPVKLAALVESMKEE